MKWFKKLIHPSCLCCGEIATKDVNEIPLGKQILEHLIKSKYMIVSRKHYEKITYRRFSHGPLARYPLCINCYKQVEEKWKKDEAELETLHEEKKKKREISEYYERLAVEIERKELEIRAKALGIDLNKEIRELNTK